MAGILIDEPVPRSPALAWRPDEAAKLCAEPLPNPWDGPRADFDEILLRRRSAVYGPVTWREVGNLLWHATRLSGSTGVGRAGIPIAERLSPSAGGLHPISFVCIRGDGSPARLYEPKDHAFLHLHADPAAIELENRRAVEAVLGCYSGCTVRFIADASKVAAAYHHPESLILRDAGVALATICLLAEWLGLAACPLGFLGHDIAELLGYSRARFLAVGGVQITDGKATDL